MGNISHLVNKNITTPLTVAVPIYNEETRILNTVYSLLNSTYEHLTIILVNDGSTDKTMDVLKERLQLFEAPLTIKKTFETQPIKRCYSSRLYANLFVLDKEHGPANNGSDCLNAALNTCKTPLFISIDADTVIEPDALSRMIYTFISHNHCVAVNGSVFMSVGCTIKDGRVLKTKMPYQDVAASQAIEHLRSFSYGRAGLNYFSGPCCIPGAFSLFEVEMLREIGGFDTFNFAYDLEMTFRLQHYAKKNGYPCKLKHYTYAVSFSELPITLKGYGHQRSKWMRGMLKSIFMHWRLLFRPKYGVISLVIFPCFIAFDIFAPVIEFITYLLVFVAFYFDIINHKALPFFILLAWSYSIMLTVGMMFLNRITLNIYPSILDTVKLFWFTTTEMIFMRPYRGLCNFMGVLIFIVNKIRGKPL